jgi:hypothetical protein
MMTAMKFSFEMTYDAPADEVRAMLADPAFREKVAASGGAIRHKVSVSPKGSGMKVVVDQTQPADGIPSFAKKIVGDEIHVVQTEVWSAPDAASLDVAIPGKPGHFKGKIGLTDSGSRTTESVTGDVNVNVPLVGGKLEQLISDLLGSALRNEQRVGRSWLAGER